MSYRSTNTASNGSLNTQMSAHPRVISAWFKRELAPGDPGALVSHGACEACTTKILQLDR